MHDLDFETTACEGKISVLSLQWHIYDWTSGLVGLSGPKHVDLQNDLAVRLTPWES